MQYKYITRYRISQDQYAEISESCESKTLQKVTIHKGINVPIVKNLVVLGQVKKAVNIDECGTFLELYTDTDGVERISRANFCRERLCSVCSWRRQSRFIATTEPALQKIDIETSGKAKYIFITFTMKNCRGKDLSAAITQLLKAWDGISRRKPFSKCGLGAIRNIEVTYNKTSRMYHPHLHVLMLVTNDYFHKVNYITEEKLSLLWKHALDVDYNPIVHIETIKSKHAETSDIMSASLEVMKYSLKATDYAISPTVTETLMNALKGRRLISFSGVIAEARKQLKYADVEDDNLVDDINERIDNARRVLYLFTPSGWKISN